MRHNPLRHLKFHGFTLIELLIVIAIIAILALIAVPNFLEAQTRAKVARVMSDFNALDTCLESYFIDHGSYPEDGDNDPYNLNERGFYKLTTPIGYMTIRPADPFGKSLGTGADDDAPYYELGSGADNARNNVPVVQAWMISSVGPNRDDDTDANDQFPYQTQIRPYAPTNGTVSYGDVYRLGGDFKAGDWKLMGIDHRICGGVEKSYPN